MLTSALGSFVKFQVETLSCSRVIKDSVLGVVPSPSQSKTEGNPSSSFWFGDGETKILITIKFNNLN